MSVSKTLHCDAKDCDTHGSPECPGWLTVSGDGLPRKHFCNGDCLLKWAAEWSQPPETIPFAPADDGGEAL